MLTSPRARQDGWLCAIAQALCILATRPFAELPVNDSFSYAKSAFDFARTGRVLYNGWSAPLALWQIVWGGAIAKLFGESFTALRVSMLVFSTAAVYLLHQILVRLGIDRRDAVLGALALALSPIFFALSATFMTDVPAVFSLLLCLYMCLRAVQAPDNRAALTWLCCAALANVVTGSVRQIAWLGALVMVPSAGWLLRKRRGTLVATLLVWLVSVAAIAACLHWFAQQPHSVRERIVEGPVTRGMAMQAAEQLVLLGLTLLLSVLPLLVASLADLRRLRRGRAVTLACMAAVAAGMILAAAHHSLDGLLAPWLLNTVTKYGLFWTADVGPSPIYLGKWVRAGVTLTMTLALLAWIPILLNWYRDRERMTARSEADRIAIVLGVPFALSYLCTVIPRAFYHGLTDRYILPLLPIFIILFLLFYQRRVGEKLPGVVALTIALVGIYSIAATHDYFSSARARLAAAQEVESAGISRRAIHGSWEYDSWTELQITGYLTERPLQVMLRAYQPVAGKKLLADECRFFFAADLPAVHPEYFVVPARRACLLDTSLPSVGYSTWLPPYGRREYIQQQKPGVDWVTSNPSRE